MPTFPEYEEFDAVGLARLIAGREVSAREVIEAAIESIADLNPGLNAVIATFQDRARAAVAGNLPSGPLRGVPFLLKDLSVHLSGTPLTNGSRLFSGYVSTGTSTIVERYEAAGLVILGKTNTPEFGLSPATEPLFTGVTRNPWDPGRSAAGSSGGSAVAVAARMVPAAHATDGGGSIRAPASACGVVGLKPTRARTPSGPYSGEGWGGFSVGHVVCRSLRDTAAFLDVTHGPAPGDPYAAPPPRRPFLREVGVQPERLRVALATRFHGGPETDPACADAATRAASLCEALGHHVEVAVPPFLMDEFARTNAVIAAHIRLAILQRSRELGRDPLPDEVEPLTWAAARTADGVSSVEYADAVTALHAVSRKVAAFFERHDVLVTPTLAKPPLALGMLRVQTDDYGTHRRKVRDFAPFTGIFNVTGQPAMSLPLAWTRDGLPIGVQFVAGYGREDVLLRLGSQIEVAAPWAHRRPGSPIPAHPFPREGAVPG